VELMQKVLKNQEVQVNQTVLKDLTDLLPQYLEYHAHGVTLNSLKFLK
jgi:hypothetical protein